MLHPESISEKDVERSIDRLKKFATEKDLVVAIPAFYYSVHFGLFRPKF